MDTRIFVVRRHEILKPLTLQFEQMPRVGEWMEIEYGKLNQSLYEVLAVVHAQRSHPEIYIKELAPREIVIETLKDTFGQWALRKNR